MSPRHNGACAAIVGAALFAVAPGVAPALHAQPSSAVTPAASEAARSALLRPADVRVLARDRSVVILQVGTSSQYVAGHVPGARPVALGDVSTPRRQDALFLEIPDTPTLERWARSVGISDATSRIVVVPATDTLQSATRVLFTLAFMGFGERVAFLDGGLSAWRASGAALEAGEAPPLAPTTGPLTIRRDSSLLAVIDAVDAATRDASASIIDARLPQFYNGNGGGYPRAGRIPSAVNVPLSLVSEGGRLKSPEELRRLFTEAGVAPGRPVITYCHIGQQATLLWFVARELGHEVRLFDGSFQEWSGSTRPVVSP
jgi:thiosulfate/3-mercaptopyruvate sulfurtransferase